MLGPHPAGSHSPALQLPQPMNRAFSALASTVRVTSPLGWAGMIGAFGALLCANESSFL